MNYGNPVDAKCIVNTDDAGLRESVNKSVEELLAKGLITSATIMVRRDSDALVNAAKIARKYTGQASFGLHLDLDEFFKFDESGYYGIHESDIIPEYEFVIQNERQQIQAEVYSQVRKLRGKGVEISHLDGHHFVHQFLPILELIAPILEGEGIPAIRMNSEFYLSDENWNIAADCAKSHHLDFPEHFVDLGEFVKTRERFPELESGITEIMVHTEIDPPPDSLYAAEHHKYLIKYASEIRNLNLITFKEYSK